MIGPYRLDRVLGAGSFATVWLAFDDVLDRQVAVKILADNWSRDNDVRRRFMAEARVLLTVESPRIVRGFHIGETPTGQPYLVMAYADRGTFGDRIEQRRRQSRTFDARETVGIATEIASAIADVHASGQLHRDVKPTNVLIRSSSTRRNIAGLAADETLVLGDFGLARGLDLSALTLVAGSPGYVAPEQAAGLTQLDRRADLYPLGRMMLEMLTGDPGGRATTMAGAATEEVDVAGLLGAADRGPGAPGAGLVDLITSLVARNPEDRPSSADEVAAALIGIARTYMPPDKSGAAPPSAPPPAPPVVVLPPPGGERPLTGTQLAASPTRRSGFPLRGGGAIAAAVTALFVVAAVIVVVALVGDDDGGSGEGTTTTPVVASNPESTSNPSTSAPLGRPIVTAAGTEVGTTEPPTTAESSAPATTGSTDSTVAPGSTEPPARLVLPTGAFSPELLTTEPPDPSEQEGAILMSADEFAAALVAANPSWTGSPPEAGDDGTLDFELNGFGRTASVHVEPAAETAGAEIVSFTIEYAS
jgi:serine/threonine protein kinase